MGAVELLIAALVALVVLVAVVVGLALVARWLFGKQQGYPNEAAIELALKPYVLRAIALAYKASERVMDEVGQRLHSFNKKALADYAYDMLPDHILIPIGGNVVIPIPVGIVKQLVSREKWAELTQSAFADFIDWFESVHEDVGDVLEDYIEDMRYAGS